jgi:hypothetical protein
MSLDGLANPLIASKVANPDMLNANCTFHCVQLQLSSPVILLIGEGGLGKRNVVQLLHSQYPLQNAMPHNVFWRCIVEGIETITECLENGPFDIKSYKELLHQSNVKKHKNNTKKYAKKLSDTFFDKEHDKELLEKVTTFKQ